MHGRLRGSMLGLLLALLSGCQATMHSPMALPREEGVEAAPSLSTLSEGLARFGGIAAPEPEGRVFPEGEGGLPPVWPVGFYEVGGPTQGAGVVVAREEEGRSGAPLLKPGDSLSLFSRAAERADRVAVRERAWAKPRPGGICGSLLEREGWTYAVEPGFNYFSPKYGLYPAVAVPAPFQDAGPLWEPPAAVREELLEHLYSAYLRARYNLVRGHLPSNPELGTRVPKYDRAEFARRTQDYGEPFSWMGPEGRVSLLSLPLLNDPELRAPGAYHTVVLAEDGRVLAALEGKYTPVYTADFHGDGVREVVFVEGIAEWRQGKWHFPAPRQPRYCP